jgi:hypothetical protein
MLVFKQLFTLFKECCSIGPPYQERLLAMLANIRQSRKGLPRTNQQAYLASSLVTKKNV